MLALNQSPNKLDEVPLEASFYTVSKRHLAAPPASPRAIGLVRKLIRALNRGNRPTLVTTSKALVTTSVALVSNSFLLLLVRHLLLPTPSEKNKTWRRKRIESLTAQPIC